MSELSAQQRAAVEHPGNFFLSACPGSGKTLTTSARVAKLALAGLRIAACSYTNVGVEQVAANLSDACRGGAQFQGTLHGFLLRYVLYPFGKLVTQSAETPRLVPDDSDFWPSIPFRDDPRLRLSVSKFHFQSDGSTAVRAVPFTFPLSPLQATAEGSRKARREKERLAQQGYVSFSDAMYWSLRVLVTQPLVARALAERFDEIVVDEAQDTTDVQLACLEWLYSTGFLKSLVLVGDTDQSISSYSGSSLAGCQQLASTLGLQELRLSENYRSSQLICDMTAHFRAQGTPDRAVGLDAGATHPPEVFTYPAGKPVLAVNLFLDRLAELGEDSHGAAVLARTNALCGRLNGLSKPKVTSTVERLGRAIASLRTGTVRSADIHYIDSFLGQLAWDTKSAEDLDPAVRIDVRAASMQLLQSAPDLDFDLEDWIPALRDAVALAVGYLTDSPARKSGDRVRKAQGQSRGTAMAAFGTTSTQPFIGQTIHDVKGETRRTVLVVTGEASGGRPATVDLWIRHLDGDVLSEPDQEELRIAFVALSRARRYCGIAIPEATIAAALPVLARAGFRAVPTS